MLRTIALALGFALSCSGGALAADELGVFVVPPPAELRPAPLGVSTQSLKLVRVTIHLEEGGPWARMRKNWPAFEAEPLVWRGGRQDVETSTFAKAFSEEVSGAGFVSDYDLGLFDNGFSADLQVGFLVDELKGNFCGGCGLVTPSSEFSGGVLMSGIWQVYSPRDRKVLATIHTFGGVERKQAKPGGPMVMVSEAVRDNVRRLIASDEFRRIVIADTAPQAVTASPKLADPHVDLSSGGRPLSVRDSVGSVVAIFSNDGLGSGFLISPDGYLITNQHVVGGSKYVKVKWSDGVESIGEVVRTHRGRDIALVKTDPRGHPPLAIRSEPIAVGETVFAVGTPIDAKLQNTLTKGIVSANRIQDGLNLIQSDVAVNHGNSGGPLLDEHGAIVGVTVSGIDVNDAPVGLNFFIPIGDALDFLALKPQF